MAHAPEQLARWLEGHTRRAQHAILTAHLYCQLHNSIREDLADLARFCQTPDDSGELEPLGAVLELLRRVVRPLLVPHPDESGALIFANLLAEHRARQRLHQRQEATRARWRRQKAAQRSRQNTPPRYVHMDTPENVHVDTKPPPNVCPRGQQNVHADTHDRVHADIAQPSFPNDLASRWSSDNVHADTTPARACNNANKIYTNSSNMAASAAAASLEVKSGEEKTSKGVGQITSNLDQPDANDEAQTARTRLEGFGMNPKTARRLIVRYSAARCAEQAEYLAYHLAQPNHAIRNPAGYLRRAIEVGYQRPAGYVSVAEQQASQQAKQEARAARVRQNVEAETRRRARAGFYQHLAQRWAELPEAERVALCKEIPHGYTPRHLVGTVDAYDHLARRLGITHPDDLPAEEAARWARCAQRSTVEEQLERPGRRPEQSSQGGPHHVPLDRSG